MDKRIKNLSSTLRNRIQRIRMILMDVDGVLTTGQLFLGNQGEALKIFHVQDGLGIRLAQAGKLKMGIISGQRSESVEHRAQELHIDILYQGVSDKLDPYQNILDSYDLRDEEVCYIGDDLLDYPLMKRVGLAIAVANGSDEIKKVAHIITERFGGEGAVREIVELILKVQKKWKTVIEKIIL